MIWNIYSGNFLLVREIAVTYCVCCYLFVNCVLCVGYYNLRTSESMNSLQAAGIYSGFDHLGIMHSDKDFTLSPWQEKNKKAMSNSPSRQMSEGRTMGRSSRFDGLMRSMDTQKVGVFSSTRLQPQITSSQCWARPVMWEAGLATWWQVLKNCCKIWRKESNE